MPLEKVEEVLSVLGYKAEDITDADTLKKKIETDWVPRNNIPSDVKTLITKNMASGVLGVVRELIKGNDIAIDNNEIEGKRIEDIVTLGFNRREEKYKAEVESLKEQVGKPDEAVSKLQKENEKLTAKLTAESAKNNKLFDEFESFKTQTTTKLKEEKQSNAVARVHAEKVKLKADISELEQEGFWRKVEKNGKPELTEDGQLIVIGNDGNPLPGKAANSAMLYEDYLEDQGIKNNVWVINPHARNQNPVIIQPKPEPIETPVRNQRVIKKPIS